MYPEEWLEEEELVDPCADSETPEEREECESVVNLVAAVNALMERDPDCTDVIEEVVNASAELLETGAGTRVVTCGRHRVVLWRDEEGFHFAVEEITPGGDA